LVIFIAVITSFNWLCNLVLWWFVCCWINHLFC